MGISVAEAAYIAALFDGEGHVECKHYKKKDGYKKTQMRISMRIQMTDEPVLRWVQEVLKVGTVRKKNRSPSIKKHWKDSWIYSVRFREALYVCKLIWPYAQVKLHKIEQIIDHYEPRAQELGDNVVDLETERRIRNFDWNVHGS